MSHSESEPSAMLDDVQTAAADPPAVRFHKVQRIWRSEPDYFDSPWDYYVRFIDILKHRGAKFITFSEALAGKYDPDAINVLLDHHIDFYVIETEVMCRWEQEHGVRSSVYLFNQYRFRDGLPQKHDWKITDLNVAFYQQLERDGFEIGYHHNAVGQVLWKLDEPLIPRQPTLLSPQIVEQAQRIFAQDVDSLSKYFDIRTVIPHGAGENNAQLLQLPEGYEERVTWVYNNVKRGGTVERPLNFRNYSESNGQRPQRFRDGNVNWINHVDNLHLHAQLIGSGLNHILIHAGRFAKGMPYETYDWTVIDESQTVVTYEFVEPSDRSQLPWRSNQVHAAWLGVHESPQPPPSLIRARERTGKYKLLTNDARVLEDHLAQHEACIASLLNATRFKGRLPEEHKRQPNRRVSDPRPLLDCEQPTPERFLSDFACFYNLIYAERPIEYLLRCPIVFDELHIHEHSLQPLEEVALLADLLMKYQGCRSFTLQLDIPKSVVKTWKQWYSTQRTNPKIIENFTVLTAPARNVGVRSKGDSKDSDPIALCVLIADRDNGCPTEPVEKKIAAALIRTLRPSLA